MKSDLNGKVVLITGASTGIGAAAALAFARLGSKLVIHYNASRKQAEAVAAGVKVAGGEADPRRRRRYPGCERPAHRRRVARGVRPDRRADQQRGRHDRAHQDRGLHGGVPGQGARAERDPGRAVHA